MEAGQVPSNRSGGLQNASLGLFVGDVVSLDRELTSGMDSQTQHCSG